MILKSPFSEDTPNSVVEVSALPLTEDLRFKFLRVNQPFYYLYSTVLILNIVNETLNYKIVVYYSKPDNIVVSKLER